jgi:hypothetical protein
VTPEWVEDNAQWSKYRKTALAEATRMEQPFVVETLEGTMRGKAGDYLMRGVHGELYPCDGKVFSETYELFSRAQDRRRAAQIAQIDDLRAHRGAEFNQRRADRADHAEAALREIVGLATANWGPLPNKLIRETIERHGVNLGGDEPELPTSDAEQGVISAVRNLCAAVEGMAMYNARGKAIKPYLDRARAALARDER